MKIRFSKDLPRRILKCLFNWTKWQRARKLGAAAVILWNNGLDQNLALEINKHSDKIWKEILS